MKTYNLKLTFAHKTDGPGMYDRYGMELTEADIKNKNYNETYTRTATVVAKNQIEAGVKAMIEMQKIGFTEGNYLYLIKVEKNVYNN